MFVFTIKPLRRKLIILVAIVALACAGCVIFVHAGSSGKTVPADGAITYSASTEQERIAFIKQFGWKTEDEPIEVAEVLIPSEFDEVYTEYNKIQTEQNLDLEPYKSCKVKKWTYIITNYPENENTGCIRINLLIYKGKVIGGDVCSIATDGFMHTFKG